MNYNTKNDISRGSTAPKERMERETGFEPATSSLGRRRATTALLPQMRLNPGNILSEHSETFNIYLKHSIKHLKSIIESYQDRLRKDKTMLLQE